MITTQDIWQNIPKERPRHIYNLDDIPFIKANYKLELEILTRNLELATSQDIMRCPADKLEYRRAFEQARFSLDRNMIACGLNWLFFESKTGAKWAKEQLLELCCWQDIPFCQVLPPTDEIGLSVARTAPAIFDWLYPILTDDERNAVAKMLYKIGEDILQRLENMDFFHNQGESHTARLPGYLGEIALALYGIYPAEELEKFLRPALQVYTTFFPYYGGSDGGWAEGPFYGSSYTKWFLPFFMAIEKFTNYSLLNSKPFYQNLSEFFVHFAPPNQAVHPFGDGHWDTQNEWPGFQAQDPFGIYAQRFGSEVAKNFSRQYRQNIDIFELHLLDIFIPEQLCQTQVKQNTTQNSFCSFDTGLCSMRKCVATPEKDIAVLARASQYGSVSHQHADQGAFAVIGANEPLLISTGYFGYQFGTEHHMKWTSQTKAHNCLLIDGQGQPKYSTQAVGKIISFVDSGDSVKAVLELTQAYMIEELIQYQRTIEFIRAKQLIIVEDELTLSTPKTIKWRLHAPTPFINSGDIFEVLGQKSKCQIKITPFVTWQMDDNFTPPCPELPNQYHLSLNYPAKLQHSIRAEISVELI